MSTHLITKIAISQLVVMVASFALGWITCKISIRRRNKRMVDFAKRVLGPRHQGLDEPLDDATD